MNSQNIRSLFICHHMAKVTAIQVTRELVFLSQEQTFALKLLLTRWVATPLCTLSLLPRTWGWRQQDYKILCEVGHLHLPAQGTKPGIRNASTDAMISNWTMIKPFLLWQMATLWEYIHILKDQTGFLTSLIDVGFSTTEWGGKGNIMNCVAGVEELLSSVS